MIGFGKCFDIDQRMSFKVTVKKVRQNMGKSQQFNE